jgi:UPF0755 protein
MLGMRRNIFIGVGIFIVLLGGALLVYSHYFGPVDRFASKPRQFIVTEDDSTYQVVDRLRKQGFIRSRTAFSIALTHEHNNGKIRPGGYEISANMDAWSMADVLGKPPYLVWFTFPPGWRKEQIADKLAKTLNWTPAQKAEWINIDTAPSNSYAEGVYYPDTYLIPSDQTPAQVAQRLRDRFQTVFAPYASEAQQKGIAWTDVLTMASLIEREAAGSQDMPLIAGIMWNRVDKNMALQIDATLQYLKGAEGEWWPIPTGADKFISSPFNTYQHVGLPPHPIAEPSLAAIQAVLNPEKTSCLYYLHSNGQIHCSASYTGQVRNVQKFLK